MQKTVYENYKYSLQDTAKVYIGAKYTFAELLDQDEVAFKFRLIVERYILGVVFPASPLCGCRMWFIFSGKIIRKWM